MTTPPNTVTVAGPSLDADVLPLVHQMLAADGYVYLEIGDERFDYLRELRRLGEPARQYNGELVREVKPEPDIGNDVYSASNMRELTPHTESYEFEGLPPRYVALWCVRPAEGPGGET